MITLEAAFGITGLIAAPIYYAYIKSELADTKLI
jgi:predicted PurR-regulated permease PerM